MSCTASPRKVLKNGEIMGPVPIDGRDIIFSNTSSYDSITEMLSHAIRQSQRVEKYFEHNRAVKKADQEFSYATTVFNQAERGPDSDAYKFRETFLYNNSNLARGRVSCFLQVPMDILTRVFNDYVDVGSSVKLCFFCIHQKLNLYIAMRELHGEIEEKIREFFASKLNLRVCSKCSYKHKQFADTLPLLSISTEHNRLPAMPTYRQNNGGNEPKASLDILPVRLTIEGCVYVLCGVIGRISSESMSYHYVAFCRNADGRWDKRDSFNEEIESLSELPVIHFSQVFYANVGYWDAIERKSLIDPAESAWYQVTKIRLPELCVHGILGYLDNEQLKFLIKGAEKDGLEN